VNQCLPFLRIDASLMHKSLQNSRGRVQPVSKLAFMCFGVVQHGIFRTLVGKNDNGIRLLPLPTNQSEPGTNKH